MATPFVGYFGGLTSTAWIDVDDTDPGTYSLGEMRRLVIEPILADMEATGLGNYLLMDCPARPGQPQVVIPFQAINALKTDFPGHWDALKDIFYTHSQMFPNARRAMYSSSFVSQATLNVLTTPVVGGHVLNMSLPGDRILVDLEMDRLDELNVNTMFFDSSSELQVDTDFQDLYPTRLLETERGESPRVRIHGSRTSPTTSVRTYIAPRNKITGAEAFILDRNGAMHPDYGNIPQLINLSFLRIRDPLAPGGALDFSKHHTVMVLDDAGGGPEPTVAEYKALLARGMGILAIGPPGGHSTMIRDAALQFNPALLSR